LDTAEAAKLLHESVRVQIRQQTFRGNPRWLSYLLCSVTAEPGQGTHSRLQPTTEPTCCATGNVQCYVHMYVPIHMLGTRKHYVNILVSPHLDRIGRLLIKYIWKQVH